MQKSGRKRKSDDLLCNIDGLSVRLEMDWDGEGKRKGQGKELELGLEELGNQNTLCQSSQDSSLSACLSRRHETCGCQQNGEDACDQLHRVLKEVAVVAELELELC